MRKTFGKIKLQKLSFGNLIFNLSLCICVLLIITTPTLSQNVLTGHVMNVSQDSTLVSDIRVKLQLVSTFGHMHKPIDSTLTDRNGRFRFRNIKSDSQATYFPFVDYNSIRYFGEPARFVQPNEQKESIIAVYDTTQSDEYLTTAMHHMFVEMGSNGAVVREVSILHNQGNHTIVAAAGDSLAEGATFGLTLPGSASDVKALSGFTPDGFMFKNGRLYDFGVIVPGTKQVSYAYNLPARNGRVIIPRTLDYDVKLFDVFIADPNLEVDSPSLQKLEPFKIRNTVYQRYAKEDAVKSEKIILSVGGAVGSIIPNSTLMILVTACILFAGVVFVKVGKKRHRVASGQANKSLQEEKRKLIKDIAHLDDQLAKQEISESKHAEEYGSIMDRLLFVEQELRLGKSKTKSGRKK